MASPAAATMSALPVKAVVGELELVPLLVGTFQMWLSVPVGSTTQFIYKMAGVTVVFV